MNELKAGRDREPGPKRVPSPDDEREIASLLEAAGSRPVVPAEHLEAIRASAHQAWREKVGRAAPPRSSWPLVAALAASLLLAAGLVWWLGRAPSDRAAPPTSPVVVASVRSLTGTVRLGTEEARALALGDELLAGAELESESGSRAALLLSSGVELRLDHGTRLRLRSAGEVELRAGAVYADTDASRGALLTVSTALGTARDIGTRFQVALPEAGALRIRVRDGAVEVSQPGGTHRTEAGQELTLRGAAAPERRALPAFGPDWDWVREAAPPFVTEGQSLRALLDWAERETGWTIRFESPELAASKEGVVLEGRAELRPDRSLLTLLLSFGLEGELEGNLLTIRKRR